MDGFPTTISFGYEVQERIQNRVADMLSRPPISASIVIQQSPLVHSSYV